MSTKCFSVNNGGIETIDLKKKNYCFIICNKKFRGKDDLEGYSADVDKINETFNGLNFHSKYEENKTAQEMRCILRDWSQMDFSNADEVIVLFIFSHGREHGVIEGTDRNSINIREVKSLFSKKQLAGIPKLIFLHACRGDILPVAVESESYVRAGTIDRGIYRDILVYYSTMEGYSALVHQTEGTKFISSICDTLKRGQISLSKLITTVNSSITSTVLWYDHAMVAQTPQAVSTLRKDITFPGYNKSDNHGAEPYRRDIKRENPCMLLMNNEDSSSILNECRAVIDHSFSSLKFQVYPIENFNSVKIVEEYKKWNENNYQEKECFACVILSSGGIADEDEVMYGINGKKVSIDVLISSVCNNKTLYGKPKLFFIILRHDKKAIEETHDDTGKHKVAGAGETIKKAEFADTFVYFVIVDSDDTTSFFIKTLCGTMVDFAKGGYHMGDMALKTNELLAKDESKDVIAEARSTLTSEVYLTYTNIVQAVQATDYAETQQSSMTGISCMVPGVKNLDLEEKELSMMVPQENSMVVLRENNGMVTQEREPEHHPKGVLTIHQTGGTNILRRGRGRGRGKGKGMLDLPGMKTRSVPTIKKLERKHVEKLKTYLDPDVGYNWKHLGHQVFRGDQVNLDKVNYIKREIYGGSKPGTAMLSNLRSKEITVKEIFDFAKEVNRIDIVRLLENTFKPSDTLKDLDPTIDTRLGEKLDANVVGASNWRDFAYKFGIPEDQFYLFETSGKRENCSPTETLLELIKRVKVDYEISQLQANLRNIQREDVVQYLDEVIRELSSLP